ncbi:FAD binding domain-containing protein [Granulosicoccus antarcticus]|uniref:Nicotinate dehydrogenase FAD-subunit n=1 Tax=Granulosicoccus antarcticus IMCC3135 TaxID=1192854 RepID=A0A2Z2NNQ7_9GAMM|nr:FAD binding domain-containing protein [Granulosicoccus antarcticus]ASJ71368.1 Nicotinate dehydrogenase FAD-subunit [Granulosicoccus antarcticus IMCC3135]
MSTGEHQDLSVALGALARSCMPIMAGGTDFYPALRDAPAPLQVIDVTRIHGLRGVEKTTSGWRIGAATTWTDIIRAPLPPVFDALKAAASEIGSIQIQNSATVAGNLCNASPAADGVPPLLTLDASVELASVRGVRILPLSEFILGPRSTARVADELMVAINIPDIAPEARSAFIKLGSRRYLVISIVMASIVLRADENGFLQQVCIAAGACSAVAQRLHELENVLNGKSIQDDLVSLVTPAMLTALSPIDDVRGSREYRMEAVQQLVRRLLADCLHDLPGNQVCLSPGSGHGALS